MTSTVRRASAFAVVGTLSLVVPVFATALPRALTTVASAGPFLCIAALALYFFDDGPLFELFARPGDRRDGRLYGLAGFALAIAGLTLLTTQASMPTSVFVASVFILSFGNVAGHTVRSIGGNPAHATTGFVVVGFLVGVGAQMLTGRLLGESIVVATGIFLAASGALAGALVRAVLFERDDPLVLLSIGLLLWLFAHLSIPITTTRILVALGVTVVLGYLSYTLETASIPGMLTGVLLGMLAIVLGEGEYGWFAMLITFFGVGGLSSKFKYEQKVERGIEEGNDGARGTGNVLANSLVALGAVLAAAASPQLTTLPRELFLFVFAGAVAAAMSDTLSSEIGGLFDHPRLVTTFEQVEPGTDGAITWQGEVAGLIGALLIAAIAAVTFETVTVVGVAVIVAAGFAGMTVDSLLGATIEGELLGNQGVNFLATLAAGLVGAAAAALAGLI